MRIQSPNLTCNCSAFPLAALRGGAIDGCRDGFPPAVYASRAQVGVVDRMAVRVHRDRSLTSLRARINRPAASGQRPAASGQRPAASGMTCARRPAGAREPSSTPPAGYPHTHLTRVPGIPAPATFSFPTLRWLLGAISLIAAAPAEAQRNDPTHAVPSRQGATSRGCCRSSGTAGPNARNLPSSAVAGGPGFEAGLGPMRREATNDSRSVSGVRRAVMPRAIIRS